MVFGELERWFSVGLSEKIIAEVGPQGKQEARWRVERIVWVGKNTDSGGGGGGRSSHHHADENFLELLYRESAIPVDVHGVKLVADGFRELQEGPISVQGKRRLRSG